MHPLPKRFKRDRLLGIAHRKLVSATLGIAFTKHTQRPQQHLTQTVADTLDPPPLHVGKKRTHSDRPGMLGKCYRPRGITIAQHLLRGLHSTTGTLDIDHHVSRQMELVGTKTTRRRCAFRQSSGGQECANLADHTAQGSIPGTRQPVRPQRLSKLIARDGAATLDYQQRKEKPGLTSIKQPLINNGISGLYRYPAGKLDPHRREIESFTNVVHVPRPGIPRDQPP